MKGKLLSILLLFFFISPLIVLFYYFRINLNISGSDFIFALKNSLIQSVSAAGFCVLLALFLAPGLSKISNRWMSFVQSASLLPSILPSIFTVLIVFSFFSHFPFGHLGVSLIFATTYLGFSIVALTQSYRTTVRKYSALVQIYQISKAQRYVKIYLPLLWKDIVSVFLIILIGCFSSLSIPLLAGGGRSANVEVLIYEAIYINGNWGAAAAMSVLQLAIIFLLSAYLFRQKKSVPLQVYSLVEENKKTNFSFFVLLGYIGLYILGYFLQVAKAIFSAQAEQFNLQSFMQPLSRSLVLAGFSLILFGLISTVLIYFWYKNVKHNFIFYFLLPSTTLVGFAAYLLFPEQPGHLVDILKVALCLNLIYSLSLYKSYIMPQIENLSSQLNVARVYSMSFLEVLKNIIYPQVKKSIFICANIIFIFSFCEFALIKAAGTQTLFSGVFIEQLISTYRLELGFIYSFIVLIGAGLFLQVTRFLNVED